MATITAANSVFMLSVLNLFPVPQQLQGFSADDVFMTDAVSNAEVVMGVDGNLSVGWVPVAKKMAITIMPDSPSSQLFEDWEAAEAAAREKFIAAGSAFLPGIGREYILTRGVLAEHMPIAPVKKVLQARTFSIIWQSIAPVPV